jgi:hypothetical protein
MSRAQHSDFGAETVRPRVYVEAVAWGALGASYILMLMSFALGAFYGWAWTFQFDHFGEGPFELAYLALSAPGVLLILRSWLERWDGR